MFALKKCSSCKNAANCTLFSIISDVEGSNLGKIAPKITILNKYIIIMVYHEFKNRVSYSMHASLPPLILRNKGGCREPEQTEPCAFHFEPTSSSDCSVSTWLFLLLHQYQPEKDLNTDSPVDTQSLTVFIKMKKLTHPSISVGVSCLHISEGFGWVQHFFPIPIVYNKSFIILKSELTFLSLPA